MALASVGTNWYSKGIAQNEDGKHDIYRSHKSDTKREEDKNTKKYEG